MISVNLMSIMRIIAYSLVKLKHWFKGEYLKWNVSGRNIQTFLSFYETRERVIMPWPSIAPIVKKCYSRFHFHVLDYCQWLRMPHDLSIPRKPRKQIELWDISSTSGNFRPYQIQTANIHFKLILWNYYTEKKQTYQ